MAETRIKKVGEYRYISQPLSHSLSRISTIPTAFRGSVFAYVYREYTEERSDTCVIDSTEQPYTTVIETVLGP